MIENPTTSMNTVRNTINRVGFFIRQQSGGIDGAGRAV